MRTSETCLNPACTAPDIWVTDSRPRRVGRRRRRVCKGCGERWTTIEVLADSWEKRLQAKLLVEGALQKMASATAALTILQAQLADEAAEMDEPAAVD